MPTHYHGTAEEILALDTFIKLTRATNSLLSRLAARETLGDLTVSQFGVLESLLHLGPLSQSELCSKQLKSGGNITMVVDNLEKHGLVKRVVLAEDRRVTMVHLTDNGKALIQEIFPRQARAIQEEMGLLAPEELKQLGQLCKKLGKPVSESLAEKT